MHQPYDFAREGSTDYSLARRWIKKTSRRTSDPSLLPDYNAELRFGLHIDEREKGLLKIAYMDQNPQMINKPIKWRYVRRWAKAMKEKNNN